MSPRWRFFHFLVSTIGVLSLVGSWKSTPNWEHALLATTTWVNAWISLQREGDA